MESAGRLGPLGGVLFDLVAELVEAGVGGFGGLERRLLESHQLFAQRIDLPGDDPADHLLNRRDAGTGRGGGRGRDGP